MDCIGHFEEYEHFYYVSFYISTLLLLPSVFNSLIKFIFSFFETVLANRIFLDFYT